MWRQPIHRFRSVAWAAVALALIAGCGEPGRPAPRDPASLAPFVASPEMIAEEMLRLAKVGKEDVVYDLGSGDGRIVITAARLFGAKGVGFELDADLVRRSTESARRAGVAHLAEFRQQDVMTVDLSPATVVTIYLSRDANLKLRPAIRTQLRPGARVVSHDFDMGDWSADVVRPLLDESGMTRHVYLWRIVAPQPTR
jgi:SAM-dependent methyltransferase